MGVGIGDLHVSTWPIAVNNVATDVFLGIFLICRGLQGLYQIERKLSRYTRLQCQ